MTAPDKPLHERIDERLEEIREFREHANGSHFKTGAYSQGVRDGYLRCAAIAERALTAGSGNE